MSSLRRLRAEFRGRHSWEDLGRCLAALRVDGEGTVTRASDEPHPRSKGRDSPPEGTKLERIPPDSLPHVRIGREVYARTPTRAGRVRLLALAAAIAPRVEIHAPRAAVPSHLSRVILDGPRRLARGALAEPGDRFPPEGFVHALFDDEELIDEACAARLSFVARRGAWVITKRSAEGSTREAAAPFRRELLRVLRIVREVERVRGASPKEAVAEMRARGRRCDHRGPIGRARLQRAIGWVDAGFQGTGPNCFRRVLAEVGLDAGAAEETLVFGLDVRGSVAGGHVAFANAEERTFAVAFEVRA